MIRGISKSPEFKQGLVKPTPLPPEAHPWFFHPFRGSVRRPGDHFMKELRAFDPELDCTWHPIHQHWSIWMRSPRIQNPICSGWSLLFNVSPNKLDARVFARLFQASGRRWGSGRDYFAAIEREYEREKQRADQKASQEAVDMAMPAFEHSQISVAMNGPSNGSKFSTYHS